MLDPFGVCQPTASCPPLFHLDFVLVPVLILPSNRFNCIGKQYLYQAAVIMLSSSATTTAYETPMTELPPGRKGRASDIEGTTPTYTPQDPYELSTRLKTDDEISSIKFDSIRKRDGISAKWRARKVRKFYQEQNENIERLLKPVDEHVRSARESQSANQLKFNIAVQGSFVANLVLAVLQVYAAATSGSLSLFTTMADAIFDPLSNITLILCNKAVKKVDPRKFPSGKARIETTGNIVFCFIMNAVSWILIVASITQLNGGVGDSDTTGFHPNAVIAVAVAFCVKLGLFLYCWALRNQYSQIRILWEDHRNDLFINGFGLITAVGGSQLKWWIDPMGALILSVLVSFLWLRTAFSEFQLLIGITADPQMLQWITYICKLDVFLHASNKDTKSGQP